LADYCHRGAGVRLTMTVVACLAMAAVPAALFPVMRDLEWAGVLLILFLLLISAACVMGGTLFSIVAQVTCGVRPSPDDRCFHPVRGGCGNRWR